jgi:hypothetical protein
MRSTRRALTRGRALISFAARAEFLCQQSVRRVKPKEVTGPKAPSWYWDPSARHQSRYFDGARWTAYVADNGMVATDPEGIEEALRIHERRRRVRRGVFWALGVLGVLGGLFVALTLVIIFVAASDVDRAGRPLVRRVEQIHAQLAASGLACRNLSVSGPAFGATESADGTCRLDDAHGNQELLIVAPPTVEEMEGPAVVGSDWYISLLRTDDTALLRDVATRLNARCVNCDA